MTTQTKTQLKKRLQSLVWRIGGMAGVIILDFIATNIGLFNLPPIAVTLVGLFVGELTKILNKKKVA